MEDLGESFELEAHQQMLDIMTKPRDSAPGPSPLGQEVRPETRHSAEIPPPSPSEHYTTEFEPDAGGNTAEWEAEDGGTPKSASALPAAASPKSTTTAYTTEFEPDDLPDSPIPELPPDLLSESGDETEHLDRVSDLESLPVRPYS